MTNKVSSPEEYLNNLPTDRKQVIADIRKVIVENLPTGFKEIIGYNMLCYVVPHELYPKGYHCNPKLPLNFISLASQKNYISLHHMGLYEGALLTWFKNEWPKHSDKKLDMGVCCIRFKKPEDVPFDLIAELCKKMTVSDWVNYYESALQKNEERKAGRK